MPDCLRPASRPRLLLFLAALGSVLWAVVAHAQSVAPVITSDLTFTVDEGATAVATLTAGPNPVEIPLVVTGGSATEHTDYTVPESGTFSSTETRTSVSVAALADTLLEEVETVVLGFGTLPSGVNAGTTPTTSVTITDQTAAARFALALNPTVIVEGSPADVRVAITNGVTFATAQTLTLSFSGSATQGTDYTLDTVTLTLPAEQSSVTTILRVTDDDDTEPAETLRVAARTLL